MIDRGGRHRVALALLLAAGVSLVPVTPGAALSAPRIAIGNARVVEGHSSYRTLGFAVTLSQATDRTVTVSFATADGTASDDSDYLARSGTVSIAAGTRSGSLGVAVLGDDAVEAHETFTVTLSSATGATISRAAATGTIINDDSTRAATRLRAATRPRVSIGDASVAEGDSSGRYIRLAVTLSAKSSRAVAVRWRAVPVTASIRWGDFAAASGVAQIPAGATSTNVAVIVKGDLADEPDQTFRVELTYAAWATLYHARGTAKILDDDAATPPASRTSWSWGDNGSGQIGDGTTNDRTGPTQIGTATDWTAIDAGAGHTCGIRAPGTLWCWGDNDYGQIGDGTTVTRTIATQIGVATDWISVDAGDEHTCGRRGTGSLWCWGRNQYGQLGDVTTTDGHSPTQIGSATDWSAVTAGEEHTCGIRGGAPSCWGHNNHGQLGDGTTTDRSSPTSVGAATDWTSISAGAFHTCGTRGGTLWCWGNNTYGQVGDGTTTTPRANPTQVGAATDWSAVTAGGYHTCGTRGGALYCWGRNEFGQVGDGSTTQRENPTQVGSATDWTSVSGGGFHTCGTRAGALWCWGNNGQGQIGDGTTTHRENPTQVGSATDWTLVSGGTAHTVGIRG